MAEQKKKRYVVLAVVAAVALLVALAPYLLSTSPFLGFVVRSLDRKLPGSLSVGSWLVGWEQGILCQQVIYTDPGRGLRLTIPRLTSTRGLLELLLAPNNLGLLVLDSPQLELGREVPPSTSGAVAAGGAESARSLPFWNHLTAEMEIRNGLLKGVSPDPAQENGLRDVSLSAALESGVLTFTLEGHTLRDQGSVKVTASLNLPALGQGWVETMVVDGNLVVSHLQVKDLLGLAGKRFSRLPEGEGFLSTDLHFKAVGLKGLELSGLAELMDAELHGGFLGEDSPSWHRLRLQIDGGRWAASGWSSREFDLACDTAELRGSVRSGGEGMDLAGKGRVNLPILFAQFPHLLHRRAGVEVQTGVLDFSVDLGAAADKQHLDLKLRSDTLTGLAEGTEFAWSEPVVLLLNGERSSSDFRVNALKVDAPFVRIDGRGNAHSFVLDASADLNQASGDLGRLFALSWRSNGRLDLAVKGTEASEEGQMVKVEADLQIGDFTLWHEEELVVPQHDFSLLGSADLPLPSRGEEPVGFDLQLALSSWLGETFVTMTGEKGTDRPLRGYYSTDTSLSLDNAAGLLHFLGILPDTATVAGDMQIQATGYLGKDELEVREFTGEIGDLALAHAGSSFAEQQVRLEITQSINEEIKAFTAHNLIVAESREKFFRTGAGGNVVNFAGRSLFLHNLSLSSATGTFTLAELLLPDWRQPLAGLEADLSGNFDLARLAGLLHGAAVVKGQADLAGSGRLSLHAGTTGQGGQQLRGELRLADVSLVREKSRTPVSQEVLVGVELSRQAAAEDIEIKEVRLDADPLRLEGTGLISLTGDWRKIEVQGRLTPALEKLSPVLREGFGVDLRLAGGQGEPFLAQYVLAGSEGHNGKKAGSLVTSLHADRLEYRGITLRSLHLPISLEQGVLHLEGTGQVGDGKVDLVVDTDLAAAPALVTMPANSQVLTTVPVDKPLADLLLAGLHPLFGVLATPAGQLDLRLNSFAWPLGQAKSAQFEAVADLRELSLSSSDLLRQILTLFSLEKEKIGLADSELTCTGREGRVACTPLRFRLGDAEMVVRGSTGLDGSLDYLLDVPVTRNLVSEEGYRFLQGATVRVAVRGTTGKPVFDREKTRATVKELLQQATSRFLEEKKKKGAGAGTDRTEQDNKG